MDVTGITVERATEIDNQSVISGSVAPGTGHLILETRGGTEIDAGLVTVPTDVQVFTASGTWTKPANAVEHEVILIAGGAGGQAGTRGDAATPIGGRGGEAGGMTRALIKSSALTATVAVTIGAGGTGGAPATVDTSSGPGGTDGGNTTFGAYLRAGGGRANLTSDTVYGTHRPSARVDGGLVGVAGGSPAPGAGPGNGGGGGGKDAATSGGNGGSNWAVSGGAGVAGGSNPGASAAAVLGPGGGGSGGGGGNGGVGIIGGAGGLYGGGGGGGGASPTGFNSGGGGAGAAGVAVIITYF